MPSDATADSTSNAPTPRKIRKGTRSCTECRRRKIRCVWLSDDARTCHHCEERGCACRAQTVSSVSPKAAALTSRARIARLEQQISGLTQALNSVEEKLGQTPTQRDLSSRSDADAPFSDTDSSDSEDLPVQEPAYLHSLFNNDLISSENQVKDDIRPVSRYQATILDRARIKLQSLIPCREVVAELASLSDQWLAFYRALGITFFTRSMTGEGMLAAYYELRKPDADPVELAPWLAHLAMTASQRPDDSVKLPIGVRSGPQYFSMVSSTINQHVLAHDFIMGTVEGLQLALFTLRLYLSFGDFTNMWILQRRTIAFAELMGLPQVFQAFENGKDAPDINHGKSQVARSEARNRMVKAQTWAAICLVDRMGSMVLNLPTATKRYPLSSVPKLDNDGSLSIRYILCTLADISTEVHDLNDSTIAPRSDTELYTQVLKIDSRLDKLARSVPRDWWHDIIEADFQWNMLRYWYFYLRLRTHMPFALHHRSNPQFNDSRLCCMSACHELIRHYINLRCSRPKKFYICSATDLQTLTATVVYLLTYNSMSLTHELYLQEQQIAKPSVIIPQLIEAFQSTFEQKGSDVAKQAVKTIESLISLLAHDDQSSTQQSLVVKVPLIGNIHVRLARNDKQKKLSQNILTSPHLQTNSVAGDSALPTISTTLPDLQTNRRLNDDLWLCDPLSWTIEDDHGSIFAQAMAIDDFNQFEQYKSTNGWP